MNETMTGLYPNWFANVLHGLIHWLGSLLGQDWAGAAVILEVFAVFLAVIVSFFLRPLPTGALVLLGLISLLITNTITMDQALSGFGDSIVWLVVAACRACAACRRRRWRARRSPRHP